jgi:hypothetical protein
MNGQPVEPVIGQDQIASAAEHKHRLSAAVRLSDDLDEFVLGARLAKCQGRTAQPQRRVRREPYPCQTVSHVLPQMGNSHRPR